MEYRTVVGNKYINNTDFENTRLPLNFTLDKVYATGYAIKIENTETDIAIIKLFFILARKFVLLIPLIYIVPHFVSDATTGVFLAEPIADALAVAFTATLFFFEFRKALKKLD